MTSSRSPVLPPVLPPDRPQGGRPGGRVRQFAWASVPVWSLSLLAFVPFLRLAVTRRRDKDWLVFLAYLSAVAMEIAAWAEGPGGGFATFMAVIVMAVAAVHAFIEFSPSRAVRASGQRPPTPVVSKGGHAGNAGAPPKTTAAPAESPAAPARSPVPGWYPDPGGRYDRRWWTGTEWSAYTRQGATTGDDSLPGAGTGGAATGQELAQLHYVEQFLDQARAEQAISAAAYRVLVGRLAARQHGLLASAPAATATAPAAPRVPPAPAASPAPVAPPAARPEPAVVPLMAPAPRPVPAPQAPVQAPPPGAVRRWWRAAAHSVRSDLAVHGLAYLGVLLLFAGLFGLVAFSFASVRTGLRPVAELAVPVAVLGSAWLLARRGLVTPARALTLLGGLLVPVAALASLVDGAAVPPDPAGIPLVAWLVAASVAVSLGYAGWWRWHRSTVLRHLVAPALWLGVAMAALGFRDPVPSGDGIVTPKPAQLAAVLIAIALTLAVPRLRAARPFAAALFPAALVGLGLAALLEGLAAGVAGWPAVPVAVSGAATLLALELSDQHIPAAVRVALESAVVGLTALGLWPGLGAGWAGAVAAVAGLMVLERGLERAVPAPALLAPIVVAAAGIAAATTAPWALLTASAAASGWAHGRRLWPAGWPFPAVLLDITAAIAPAGVLAALLGALPDGQGAATAGVLVLAGAVLVRVLARPADAFWSWWVPAAAIAVAATTAGQPATAGFAVAAAAAAVALALSPAPAAARVWLTGAAAIWAAARIFEMAGAGFGVQMVAVAGAALAAVAVAAWRRDNWAGHAGVFGHLAGLACWPAAAYQAGSLEAAAPTAVLGLAVASAAVTTIAQEAGHACVPDLLVRSARRLMPGPAGRGQALAEAVSRHLPAVLAAVLLPVFAASVAGLAGVGAGEEWLPVGLTALALTYVLLSRAVARWHRVARVLADVGAWGTVLAAVGCGHRDPAIVALAGVMVTPVLETGALRRRVTAWVAWAASVPFAVLAANLAGLPLSYWYVTAFGWGAALLLGGLVADEVRVGRRQPGQVIRTGSLIAPVAVGTVASAAGLAGSVAGFPHTTGWMLISGAAVMLAAGALLRLGLVGGSAAVMALIGTSLVVPWDVRDHPWLLLVAAAVLLVAAQFTSPRTEPAPSPWLRWDLPLFLVAHAAALTAVALAVLTGTAAGETMVGSGALAFAVAARLRRWPWTIAGTVLILAGAAEIGPGWACLAFAGTSAAATVLAARNEGRVRALLQMAGALAAIGAWAAGLIWRDAAPGTAVEATSLAAGALALLAAAAARVLDAAREWARVWGGTAVAMTAVAAVALASPRVPPGAGLFAAAGLAASGLGCALAAAPLRLALLRESAAAGAVAAGLAWAYGISAGLDVVTWGAVAAGAVASASVLAPWLRRGAAAWVRPALAASVAATGVALGAAWAALPDRGLLIPAFILAGVLAVALAVGTHRAAVAAITPIPLCAAWLIYASEALTGQPQWFTMPLGAALLAVAVLLRSARRADGRPVATPDVISLEVTGMGLLVGASLVQSVTESTLYALVGAGLGVAIAGWGALTRVRRRLFGGMIAAAASLLLLIIVPLVPLASQVGGMTVWLVLAGAGLAAIAAAALLDTTRSAIHHRITRFAELTRDWE